MSESDLYPVRLIEMIDEVRREVATRTQVFSRAASEGRMNRRRADRRIAIMQAVLSNLEAQAEETP